MTNMILGNAVGSVVVGRRRVDPYAAGGFTPRYVADFRRGKFRSPAGAKRPDAMTITRAGLAPMVDADGVLKWGGAIPAGYRWRVSLWPWPTPAETEAALLHDWRYERAGRWRRAADRRFVRSLPPGLLRAVCRTPVAWAVFRIGWWC